ncbi:MAG: hypothetical protein AB8I08_17415 [Sandaracinaceae bacterium]
MKRLCVVVALLLGAGCGGDGGTGDAGPDAGGGTDGGMVDSGTPVDAGPADAGRDAGRTDAGNDAGAADGGPTDGGPTDGGPVDGGPADAGTDAGMTDAGMTDAGPPDGGDLDAGSFGIGGVDYRAIARGGSLQVRGAGFTGATSATLGGISHAVSSVTETSLVIDAVDASTPLGRQPLRVVNAVGETAPFDVVVIHLQINEVEVDSPGSDLADFVELSTGVDAPISLDGYVLAHYNGSSSAGQPRVASVDLAEGGAETDGNGLLLVANTGVPTTPDIVLGADLQQGEDLVAIYQRRTPAPLALADIGTTGLIDAVVWESGSDADEASLDVFSVGATRVVQIGATSEARQTTSIQRCGREEALRDLSTFERETPSPGLPNHCGDAVARLPACVVDFGTVCPDTVEGACGSHFQSNRSDRCAAPVTAECSVAGVAYGADVSDGGARVDIFLVDALESLDTFFVGQDSDVATMRFFDIDGNEVDMIDIDDVQPPGPIEADVDCLTGAPARAIRRIRPRPDPDTLVVPVVRVRRILIEGAQGVWLDNFVINPS